MNVVSELVKELIDENSTKLMNQYDYIKKYDREIEPRYEEEDY